MTIQRTTPGECDWRLSAYRNGERLQTEGGEFNLLQFCQGWSVTEDISLATMEAEFIFQDAIGIQSIFTGSETLKLEVFTSLVDRVYNFRCTGVFNRIRDKNNSEMFSISAVSEEFIKNEGVNVFGSSETVFKNNTETENIVSNLLKNDKFLGTKKNVFVEDTVSRHNFIIPNWRPLDVVYWLTNRSVRKSSTGNNLQNGFLFYENSLGYNFKSIDKIIEDVNTMGDNINTDIIRDKKRLYRYTYAPKNLNEELDNYTINAISFPEEHKNLIAQRHGTIAGYSVGFDPVNITASKMGLSSDISDMAYEYNIRDVWSKMSHLDPSKTTNPLQQMDVDIQNILYKPKRVRYTMLPNQIFDQKYRNNPQKNYKELVQLQAYQYMRVETLKNLKALVRIPGNIDLYAGSGIDISLPAVYKSGTNIETDRRYSGKYVIVRLTHTATTGKIQTELELMKDSILK
tara:strand:+ start:2766 stop:4139 length:1374 start_codon:yes stop_codon:yes gene_type:complete